MHELHKHELHELKAFYGNTILVSHTPLVGDLTGAIKNNVSGEPDAIFV